MLIAHADWSLHPRKRWMTLARRTATGWSAAEPVPVGELPELLPNLRRIAGDAPVLLGIDTPLGLPAAYAELAGIGSFRDFLAHDLNMDEWAEFAVVSARASEISLRRPFYPFAPGKKGEVSLQHLVDGLGMTSAVSLQRGCELASVKQPGMLFWTLGANQTGKAALRAWTELIRPALADDPTVRLWPFDGDLPDLLTPGTTVIAETYPAAAANLLGIPIFRKTCQEARRAAAADIERVCGELGIVPSEALREVIENGFGPEKAGEDPFDAVLGLLGMVAVVAGGRATGVGGPNEPVSVRTVEGWILGVSRRTGDRAIA